VPWWGWAIIAAVVVIAALIVGYIWGRKASPDVDRAGLADSERKALEAEIEAGQIARAEAVQARDELAKDLKATLAWYNAQKDAIDDDAQKQFTDLVSDPAALDRKLDALLSPTKDDPTKPGAADEGGKGTV
jgi:hypothetical protein